MNTPPRARSTRAEVPPTPRHGARFDSPPPTSRKSRGPSSSSSFSTATLSPPPSSPLGPESSPSFETRKHRKRRASVLDEPAEKPVEVESEGWKELEKMFGKDFGRRPTLVNPAGRGLPTPSKTPARKKKHLSIESLGGSARRLFGSSSFAPATSKKNVLGSMPSKSRKRGIGRLGLLGEDEDDDGGSIDIFTDSNAQIPKFDPSPDNPFITRPGDAKKKKQERKAKKPEKTNKLGDDGRRDDGMVYIFRGKKMFRKFSEMNEADDPLPKKLPKTVPRPLPAFFGKEEEEENKEEDGIEAKIKEAKVKEAKEENDEEEEFDEEDDEEVMRILNKRSTFRPRLLFPSKEVGEDEPSEEEEEEEEEEEVETDVEEVVKIVETTSTTVSIKKISRSAISRLTPDSDDDFPSDRSGRRVKFEDDDVFNRESTPKSTRKRRSMFDEKISSVFDEEESSAFDKKRSNSHKKSSIFDKKRSSFFDEEVEEPIESLLGKDTKKGGAVKEKRKRARGGSFDAPGLHTPRKEKKTRGTVA